MNPYRLAELHREAGPALRKYLRAVAAADASAHGSPAQAEYGRIAAAAEADPERFKAEAVAEEAAVEAKQKLELLPNNGWKN